jgi:hypothetical protein
VCSKTSAVVAVSKNDTRLALPIWATPMTRVHAFVLESQQTGIPPRLKKRDWKAIEYLIPPLLQDWFKPPSEKESRKDDNYFKSDKYYTV